MKVAFAGQEILLHHAGVALLPKCSTAVVSDMHLEKGSHFAQRGYHLPPYDSQVTLLRLLHICAREQVRQLIILGDCFHDEAGFGRLDREARALFDRLLSLSPVWIKGNHDGEFVPPGFEAHEALEEDSIAFRHEAAPGLVNELSGHFHPKVQIHHKGAQFERPCFIEDGRKMILPAFGAYAGGLAVTNVAIRRLFSSPRVHVLGQSKVYSLPG